MSDAEKVIRIERAMSQEHLRRIWAPLPMTPEGEAEAVLFYGNWLAEGVALGTLDVLRAFRDWEAWNAQQVRPVPAG